MSDPVRPPSLTDARGLGGIIAQDGFDYQLWDGLARLPPWLANPTFEQMLFEGLEDLEARFFAPYAPQQHLLERYQAKSGMLGAKEIADVFASFKAFEDAYPRHTRLFTLVTPQLASSLRWIGRDPKRVRKARPFYAPFPAVVDASDVKLRADLDGQFGSSGAFVANFVEISERVLPDRDSAVQAFGFAFSRSFPDLALAPRIVERSFEDLSAFARKNIGVPLKRQDIVHVLEEATGVSLFSASAFPLLMRSDRKESDERYLEIDASAFSGGENGYPPADVWKSELATPLLLTAQWLRASGINRVTVAGSYRLSTAMVLGWAFRAATGFELELPTRDGAWATDDRPTANDAPPSWQVNQPTASAVDNLVVTIGVLRDPIQALPTSLTEGGVLSLFLAEPVTSARMAQQSVALIKKTISEAAGKAKAKKLLLYFAGPAVLAAALGHRWNAMPPTQLHEFIIATRNYVPTARL